MGLPPQHGQPCGKRGAAPHWRRGRGAGPTLRRGQRSHRRRAARAGHRRRGQAGTARGRPWAPSCTAGRLPTRRPRAASSRTSPSARRKEGSGHPFDLAAGQALRCPRSAARSRPTVKPAASPRGRGCPRSCPASAPPGRQRLRCPAIAGPARLSPASSLACKRPTPSSTPGSHAITPVPAAHRCPRCWTARQILPRRSSIPHTGPVPSRPPSPAT